MAGVILLQPGQVVPDPGQQTVHSNATLTSSGSLTFSGLGSREITLIINVKNAPTGTTPSLAYTLTDVDPGDQTTAISGQTVTCSAITGITATPTVLVLRATVSSTVRVSWTVTGTSPSFTGVYATLLAKNTPLTLGYASGVAGGQPILLDAAGRVTVTGNALTVGQGGQGSAGGAWFTRLTDGTNFMPTGDVAVRGVYNRITDGTNTATVKAASTAAASADTSLIVGLSPNSPIPTGTNTIGKIQVVDGSGNVQAAGDVASRGLYTRITDGTNTMPTGDVAARGIYHRITDGANVAAVKAASVAAAATDPSLVVALSPNAPIPTGTNTIGKIQVVDGSGNVMPSGDVASRGQYNRVTDGTNTAAVKAASTAAVAADPSLVVQISPNQTTLPVILSAPAGTKGTALGYVRVVAANTDTPVRFTSWSSAVAQTPRYLASTSALDGGAAGSNAAKTVLITFYGGDNTGPYTETVTLNGTTAVATTSTNIGYVESMFISSTTDGPDYVNRGTVTLYYDSGKTIKMAEIGLNQFDTTRGDGRTFYAHHFVPSGKICNITKFTLGALNAKASNSVGVAYLRIFRTNSTQPSYAIGDILISDSYVQRTYETPLQVTGPMLIAAYVRTPVVSTSADFAVSFDYYDV